MRVLRSLLAIVLALGITRSAQAPPQPEKKTLGVRDVALLQRVDVVTKRGVRYK